MVAHRLIESIGLSMFDSVLLRGYFDVLSGITHASLHYQQAGSAYLLLQ
jgi:hypothetical protein